ncbi:cytochrome-c oxidase, cbb3-type subunit III [Kiloniella sp. b19]|uniref:cytochrome-c oxidase, cbb3-type subunit III n=1 Tax=Kiloniella sp. GXU_MW_B19 TaxID=3141326 RepID=UPI0031E1B36A
MAKPRKDDVTGIHTTGHEWDGIEELNTPMPRWWLYVFYACVVWAIGYWVLYPAWPLGDDYTRGVLGHSLRQEALNDVAAAKEARKEIEDRLLATELDDARKDEELMRFALANGKSAFGDNCAACHGSGAAGAKGFPNLNDDDWLWGGTLEAIHETLRVGIRAENEDTRFNDMPAFLNDGILDRDGVNDVAEYVLSLSGVETDKAAATRGEEIFASQCTACHGDNGQGLEDLGAPNLTDAIWLYGGDKDTLVETIAYSRRGVMPAWEERLDPATIKSLALFIHSRGGGQ